MQYKNIIMKKLIIALFTVIVAQLNAQIDLTIGGVDSVTTTHNGYEITRTSQTNLIFRYNSISTAIDDGFMLMAGDNDYSAPTCHVLDCSVNDGASPTTIS